MLDYRLVGARAVSYQHLCYTDFHKGMSVKKRQNKTLDRYTGLIFSLLLANGVSLLLFLLRVIDASNTRYWFLIWNLVLAWLPLVFVLLLLYRLQHSPWRNAANIALTIAWVIFLPNSFYIVSDLIHLQTTTEVGVLYDAVLFTSFIFNGFLGGFTSLYLVHNELDKRLKARTAHLIIAGVLLICSFAVHLGRTLRWNTWDVFLHPTGLLFDVSEQVVNESAQSKALVTTVSFFLLLGGMYMAIWQFAKVKNRGR